MGYAIISEVLADSIAEELELEPGDKILKINDQKMNDLIDFQFLWADEEIDLLIEKKNGEELLFEIEKDYDENLGVIFESAIFDGMRYCHNNCIFCFVAQMAPGMRKSLYVKDDDYRLSFLQGNFITFTNLDEEHFNRIKKFHLSPLYVSVHVTDPDLRVKLLNNSKAHKIMDQLRDLTEHGIEMHTQIVLCPGINDGKYLDKSISDLGELYPGIKSISVVPVGTSKYTKNPERFPNISKEYALNLIEKIEEKQNYFRKKFGHTLVFVADELYVKAQKEFPPREVYEEFAQTENGIGVGRLFLDDFNEASKKLADKIIPKKYVVVTGVSGQFILKPVIDKLKKVEGLDIELLVIENDFFGSTVTVTGLLTGTDLVRNLKNLDEDTNVLISDVMLKKDENIFLDGQSFDEVQEKISANLICIENNAEALVNEILR